MYALAIGPLRQRFSVEARFPLRECFSFYLGLFLVYLAVGSPLDQLGEQFLFSAHMLQHMVLIYFAPTCFFFGIPGWLWDSLLENKHVEKAISVLTPPRLRRTPLYFVYTAWHIPVLYEAALQDKRIHILEHWTMFCLGFLMLWPFLTSSDKVLPQELSNSSGCYLSAHGWPVAGFCLPHFCG